MQTREEAATKIQKVWRGYHIRAKKPQTANPSDYSCFIRGNEPLGHLAPEDAATSPNFVYVGTSCLQNFYWLKGLVQTPPVSLDGYTNTPKVFIVDNSKNVEIFWGHLKKGFSNSNTLEELAKYFSAHFLASFNAIATHDELNNLMPFLGDLCQGSDKQAWFNFLNMFARK